MATEPRDTAPSKPLQEYVELLRIVATSPETSRTHEASPIAHLTGEAAHKAGLIGGHGNKNFSGEFKITNPHLTPDGARALFEWTALLERDSVKHRLLTRLEQVLFLAVGALLAAVPQFFSDPPIVNCTPPAITAPAPAK